MKQTAGYIGAAIAVLGVLFNAASQWGAMNTKLENALQRIQQLEVEGRYLHGNINLPKGSK